MLQAFLGYLAFDGDQCVQHQHAAVQSQPPDGTVLEVVYMPNQVTMVQKCLFATPNGALNGSCAHLGAYCLGSNL